MTLVILRRVSLSHVWRSSLNLQKNRRDIQYGIYRVDKQQYATSSNLEDGQLHTRPHIDPRYSYVYGRSNHHFTYSTVNDILRRAAELDPDRYAIISYTENIRRTFAQFSHDVDRVVKGLIEEFDIHKGDHIGLFAYNCYKWPLIQIACNVIGAILVPINPSNKPDELTYILEKGFIKLLFIPGPRSPQCQLNDHIEVLNSQLVIDAEKRGVLSLRNAVIIDDESYTSNELNPLWKLKLSKYSNWSQVFENDGNFTTIAHEFDPNVVSPDDVMGIYFTSGTTGKPKGASVSHFTAVNNVAMIQRRLYGHGREWEKRRVICNPLPMFHIFAGVLNTLGVFQDPSTIVYTGPKYDIEVIAAALQRESCNVLIATPTIIIDLLSLIENQSLKLNLKTVLSGGAALKPEIVKRAYELLPELEMLTIGYGSTENGGVSTVQTIHEPRETRSFSVGPPIDHTEIKIVDVKTGHTTELGREGEIWTRGMNTMIEYFEDPVKTDEVITPARWYRTGDVGKILPHGSLQIVGRIKELIIKGGENVYPKEVEELLLQNDQIEDAYVVGVPDERFGEEICAWVKLKSASTISSRDIKEFCRANITYFKVPKYVLLVDEFPMTATKKAQKHIMRDKSIELLKLNN